MAQNQGGSASVFEIPLSLTQTPVSSVGGGDVVTTGAFFGTGREETPFSNNPVELLPEINTVQGLGLTAIAAAALAFAVFTRLRK